MLKKIHEFDVPQETPWINDRLKREPIATRLTSLIRTLTQPFVLSINSPWGTGKTSFVRMWSQSMRNEGQPCIYFNAWKNDFSDNPFVSFMSEIQSYINSIHSKKEGADSSVQELFETAKRKAGIFAGRLAPLAIKIATRGAINDIEDLKELFSHTPKGQDDVAEFLAKAFENKISEYTKHSSSIEAFKESLGSFAEKLTGMSPENGPLVIFVDELDRCRPDFAINLLESIKHLFNVPKVLFVISVDKEQLRNSIKTIYGNEMNPDGYLRRFIDLEYEIERPDTREYPKVLFSAFNLSEALEGRKDARNMASDLIKVFTACSEMFRMSLRDQEQFFCKINVILRMTPINNHVHIELLIFLLCLKMHNEEIFSRISLSKITPDEVLKFIDRRILDNNYIPQLYNHIDFLLCRSLTEERIFDHYIEDLRTAITSGLPGPEETRAKYFLGIYRHYGFEYRYNILGYVLELIGLSYNYS